MEVVVAMRQWVRMPDRPFPTRLCSLIQHMSVMSMRQHWRHTNSHSPQKDRGHSFLIVSRVRASRCHAHSQKCPMSALMIRLLGLSIRLQQFPTNLLQGGLVSMSNIMTAESWMPAKSAGGLPRKVDSIRGSHAGRPLRSLGQVALTMETKQMTAML